MYTSLGFKKIKIHFQNIILWYVIFQYRCDNKNSCNISAKDYNFGPDPCPDTERYLEAHYVCVQKQSYVTTGK